MQAHPLHKERGVVVAARVLQRAVHSGVDVPARAVRTTTACAPCSTAGCRRWQGLCVSPLVQLHSCFPGCKPLSPSGLSRSNRKLVDSLQSMR